MIAFLSLLITIFNLFQKFINSTYLSYNKELDNNTEKLLLIVS